jgi:hypothetical protein
MGEEEGKGDDGSNRSPVRMLSGISESLAQYLARIAASPLFAELRRFPQGRAFKQWTGDDSKALMKVISRIASFLCSI